MKGRQREQKFYFYKLTTDNGGAPCIDANMLSLAICKPSIRRTSQEGDLIFGFSANSLSSDNRLIYIARITKKLKNGEYYTEKKYETRGDSIYEKNGDRYEWKEKALHHGPADLKHDIGEYPKYTKINVLLSDDFRYLGSSGTSEYKSKFPTVCQAIETLGRGHRVNHTQQLRTELQSLKDWVWLSCPEKISGKETSKPSRNVCHRSKSCGVI